jgi:glutamyl-Q tRNA(Asp) synthetase
MIVTRFAPSPTGFLHLPCVAAVTACQTAGGRFLLRIEDIDTVRRPEFETAIKQDLRWLGLEFDEPVRRQSEHLSDYAAAIATPRSAA